MNRSLLIVCLSALLFTCASPAQRRTSMRSQAASDVANAAGFPLATGNYWVFERDTGDGVNGGRRMAIGEAVTRNGAVYFELDNAFGPDALVRTTEDGRLFALDPETGAESLWYDFGAADGGSWTVEGLTCLDRGRIAARGLEANVPAGQFSDAIKVELRDPQCADAGSTDELFVAGVGMIEHEEVTFAGPQRYRLTEARVDGKLFAARAPGVRLTLTLDKPVYTPNLMPPVDPTQAVPVLRAVLKIENTSGQPLRIDFPSGQQFEAQIIGPSGERLYTWSATRLFTQATSVIELDNGSQQFTLETPLGNAAAGQPWPAGRYVLRTWLPASGGVNYESQMPFEITEPAH